MFRGMTSRMIRLPRVDDEEFTRTLEASLTPDDLDKVIVRKPWGHEQLLYETTDLAIWLLKIQPGCSTSLHCHPQKDTELIVLSGTAVIACESAEYRRDAREGVSVPSGVFHRTAAFGDEPTFVLELESPNNKLDLVRKSDEYGRAGTNYEGSESWEWRSRNMNLVKYSHATLTGRVTNQIGQSAVVLTRAKCKEVLEILEHLDSNDLVSVLRTEQGFSSEDFRPTSPAKCRARLSQLPDESIAEILFITKVPSRTSGADRLAKGLSQSGILQVFGVEDATTVHLVEAMGRTEDLHLLCFPTERAAGFAAIGYAYSSGKAAALLLGSGSSMLRGLEPIALAWFDSIPLVAVGPEVPQSAGVGSSTRQRLARHLPLEEAIAATTKAHLRLDSRYGGLAEAVRIANSPRKGPVVLSVGLGELTKLRPMQGSTIPSPSPPLQNRGAPDAVGIAADLIGSAERPVMVLGRGLIEESCQEFVEGLGETFGFPMVSTRGGKQLLTKGCRLGFGVAGGYGNRAANLIVQNADLVLVVGASMGPAFTGRDLSLFAREANVVIVDIDANEANKLLGKSSVGLVGDAHEVLMQLMAEVKQRNPRDISPWVGQCEEWHHRLSDEIDGSPFTRLISERLGRLSSGLPDNTTVVVDGGWIQHVCNQHLEIGNGQGVLTCSGLEEVGFAIPAAIGCMAATDRKHPILVVTDERGVAESIDSLLLARDLSLNIVCVVFDAAGQSNVSAIRQWAYPGSGANIAGKTSSLSDIASLVGMGFEEFGKSTTGDQLFRGGKGPIIVRVEIGAPVVLEPRPGFWVDDDGVWHQLPLEDLAPLMSLERLQSEMTIDVSEVSRRARR